MHGEHPNQLLLACHNAARDIAELQETCSELTDVEKAVARIIYGHVLEAVNTKPATESQP